MTPERWQQIKQLVQSAVAEDAAMRSSFLQQSCPDDLSMRLGAEALLSWQEDGHEDATRKFTDKQEPLSPQRWQQVERLFQSALELEPKEREAFLARECGHDDALRHEVESLLVYQAAAGGMIAGAIQEAAGLLPNENHAKARFTPGTTLNKRYRIIGLLGRGGMGEVYRADDLKLGHPVALKFLTEKFSQDRNLLARFHSEVSMAHRVTHPNVCRVHDIGDVTTAAGTLHFLSMEYVDGEDLSSLLRRIGRLPSDKAVEIANQLCAGLAAAHEAGVLHRDLKPANVMLDGKGRVRITDFGLAGFAEQIRGAEVMAGTPAYMSPEQFAGKEVTTRSDIYALGLVLYELFTGKRVFEAGSLDELRRLHESSSPTNPSSWVKDIDPLVERVILRCLEKDPSKRLASAKQVSDALPGGDPLAAALALGETPSPEMVAAAGSKEGMKPKYAVACLLAIVAGLVIVAMMNRRLTLIEQVGLTESPEVMAGKARAIFMQLGYPDASVTRAYGLLYDPEYLDYIEKNGNAEHRKRLLVTGQTPAISFWYRESSAPMTGFPIYVGRVSPTDPPEDIPGMRSLSLDPAGRLLRFGAVPPQVEKNPVAATVPDWNVPFALAGLDINQFTAAEPEWAPNPLGPCDIRAAWTGIDPVQPAMPIRIEAAGYHGKLTSFQLLRPHQKAWRLPPPSSPKETSGKIFSLAIWLAMVVTAIWLTKRNLQNGRSDVRGAVRLAMSVFAILFTVTLFSQLFDLSVENIMSRLLWPVYSAVFFAVMYLALEPYVRRKWPHIVISWNRLLYGGLRDPLVGRDLLVGLLAGLLVALTFKVSEVIGQSLGHEPARGIFLETLFDTKFMAIIFAIGINVALNLSFATCLVIFLFRLVLQRTWLVFTAFLFIATAWTFFTGPLMFVPLSILATSIAVFMLTRFGLLSLVAALWMGFVIQSFLITTNLSAWYASNGLFAVGVVLVVAIYAFHTSLGGQKVFAGKLLEE